MNVSAITAATQSPQIAAATMMVFCLYSSLTGSAPILVTRRSRATIRAFQKQPPQSTCAGLPSPRHRPKSVGRPAARDLQHGCAETRMKLAFLAFLFRGYCVRVAEGRRLPTDMLLALSWPHRLKPSGNRSRGG